MEYKFTPYVLQCMRFCHKSPTSPTRIVMDYEFDFCISCDRELWIDDKYYKVDKGCFVIRKPGQRSRSKGSYDCYMMTLDFSKDTHSQRYSRNSATHLQELFDSDMWDILPSVFKPAHYDDYARIFEVLVSLNETDINDNSNTHLLINELLHLLMSDAFLYYASQTKIHDTPIDNVCSYIKKNYAEDIKLDDLASLVHMNKNHLVRQFKKSIGMSPIAYLINIRMEHAKKLLVESTLPIKTVALVCGYNSPAFFNSYFKKSFGVSPATYRRSYQLYI